MCYHEWLSRASVKRVKGTHAKGNALFGIGGFELFLILLFGFLIFGPDKLPAMAKTLGKAIAKFRSAQDEMNKVIKEEKIFDPDAEDPFKNPLDALEKMGNAAESGAKNVKKAATSTVNAAKDAKQESFSERKARYDRERAARKEAEKAEAEKRAAADAVAATAARAEASKADAKPTADELYGNASESKEAKAAAADAPASEEKGE